MKQAILSLLLALTACASSSDNLPPPPAPPNYHCDIDIRVCYIHVIDEEGYPQVDVYRWQDNVGWKFDHRELPH